MSQVRFLLALSMIDSDFNAALAEAISFHQEVIAAMPPYSHAALRGRHARALAVLVECRARLSPPRRELVSVPCEAWDDGAESLVRRPYKD